jgi:hypothetical protein
MQTCYLKVCVSTGVKQASLLKGKHAGKMAPAYTLRYWFMKFGFVTTCTFELVNYICLIQMQQFLLQRSYTLFQRFSWRCLLISTNYAQFCLIFQEPYACSFSVQKMNLLSTKNYNPFTPCLLTWKF